MKVPNKSAVDSRIKLLLEAAYQDFHSAYYRDKDPVSMAYLFKANQDREVVAFLCSLISYGNVKIILANAKRLLEELGTSPHQTIIDQRFLEKFSKFRHRFTAGDDIKIICYWLSLALREAGSLEAFFVESSSKDTRAPFSMKEQLSDFVNRFAAQPLPKSLADLAAKRERGLKYLLSDPTRGSACKRLNMFLRWMVRKEDGVDLGLWKKVSPKDLMLPIDTHVLQTLQLLTWTESKTATWKVSEEATQTLRLYHAEDPIRYDFALCHLSMAGKNIAMYFERFKIS